MSTTVKAKVVWFNEAKGYGLAQADDPDIEDIKIELSSLTNTKTVPARGDRVEVTFKEEPIGLVAEKVTLVESATDRHERLQKLIEFTERMPKVNLHIHLEGAIFPSTLFEIAQKNNYMLGVQDAGELAESFKFHHFRHFIDMYSLCSNALKTSDDYYRITYEYLRDASQQGIRYVEAYFSPYDRMRHGLDFEQIVEGVSRGEAKATEELGIRANFVMDVGRHLLWTEDKDPDRANKECIQLVERAADAKAHGVIGFCLGGKEFGYPVHPFAEAFERARQRGLYTKAHSGEDSGPQDTWEVIKALKVDRIVDPVHAREDKALVEHIARHRIPLDMCPTGNILTDPDISASNHPLPYYLDQGIPVTLGSGDPALFNTTLTKEYQWTVEHLHFSADDLQRLVLESVQVAWLDEEEKGELRASFEREIKQLRQELGV